MIPPLKSSFTKRTTPPEDSSCSSTSSRLSLIDPRQVRFDPILRVHCVPSVEDEEKEHVWWQAAELKREMLDFEEVVQNYRTQIDVRSRWRFFPWRNTHNNNNSTQQQQGDDELCGIVKSIKLLFISKRPTERAAKQLTACLDRAPDDVRGLERRLGRRPYYDAAVRRHVRVICLAQHQRTAAALADRAAYSSVGSVLLGRALARHDAGQAYHPHR